VPDGGARARAKDVLAQLPASGARRVVFVDGAFVPELSDLARLETGLTMSSMGQALAAGNRELLTHLNHVVPTGDVAVALNTAFMGDGALIHIAQGAALAQPLHLVFVNAGREHAAVFIRSLVVIESGARAMLLESHVGSSAREDQVNAVLELKVGDGAHVDHVKITGEGAGAMHVSTLMAAVGAHARFNEFLFTTGGGVVRNQAFVHFGGGGPMAGNRGASLLKGRQHPDTTLVVDHPGANCTTPHAFQSAP